MTFYMWYLWLWIIKALVLADDILYVVLMVVDYYSILLFILVFSSSVQCPYFH